MQQSLLLLFCRTALWLRSNFPRNWLSGEGAVTNVHLGESSPVSQTYRTHMQIETTKEKHSISDGKTGFLKKLANSTILGFINQNKILQFCMHYLCLLSKSQYFKLNYWTSHICCFVKHSSNAYKNTFRQLHLKSLFFGPGSHPFMWASILISCSF